MRDIIIRTICLIITYVLFVCIVITDGFDWITAAMGAEVVLATAYTVYCIVKRCK